MAKGLAKSAADAVRAVAGTAVNAAATAAATLVVERIAASIVEESRKQPPSHGPGPVVDQAVQQLLAPPVKHKARKVVKKAAAKKQKSVPRAKKALQKKRDAGSKRLKRGVTGARKRERRLSQR